MQALDDIDRRLLRLLQDDASLTAGQLAKAAGVGAASCWRRIERMERDGVIKGRSVEIDPSSQAARAKLDQVRAARKKEPKQ